MEMPLGTFEKNLGIMKEQSLYAKASKCEFGMTKILYLGHTISENEYRYTRRRLMQYLIGLHPKP